MPRRLRTTLSGYVYHVLNRGVGRANLFDKPSDNAACIKVLRPAHEQLPMRLLAYCLMPNHWHLVVWRAQDGSCRDG
jgi:putative transposase